MTQNTEHRIMFFVHGERERERERDFHKHIKEKMNLYIFLQVLRQKIMVASILDN